MNLMSHFGAAGGTLSFGAAAHMSQVVAIHIWRAKRK